MRRNIFFTDIQLWSFTLWVVTCLLLDTVQDDFHIPLMFQHQQWQSGYLWQMWTSHLVHINLVHFVVNGLALLLLMFVTQQYLDSRSIALCCISAMIITLAIWLAGVQWYCGFSGVLHALALFWIMRMPTSIVKKVLFYGIALKLGVDFLWQNKGFVASGVPTIILAHFVGAAVGVVYFSVLNRRKGAT